MMFYMYWCGSLTRLICKRNWSIEMCYGALFCVNVTITTNLFIELTTLFGLSHTFVNDIKSGLKLCNKRKAVSFVKKNSGRHLPLNCNSLPKQQWREEGDERSHEGVREQKPRINEGESGKKETKYRWISKERNEYLRRVQSAITRGTETSRDR